MIFKCDRTISAVSVYRCQNTPHSKSVIFCVLFRRLWNAILELQIFFTIIFLVDEQEMIPRQYRKQYNPLFRVLDSEHRFHRVVQYIIEQGIDIGFGHEP